MLTLQKIWTIQIIGDVDKIDNEVDSEIVWLSDNTPASQLGDLGSIPKVVCADHGFPWDDPLGL